MIVIAPLTGIGEIRPGADLAGVLGDALREVSGEPSPDDVLVVTQKIVSKAEDRFVDLASVQVGADASRLAEITRKDPRLVQLVLDESVEVLRAVPNVLITRHRLGLVMANAGIDRSNLGPGGAERVLLLPLDPDGTAHRLSTELGARRNAPLAVVISDSFGRPWRHGVVSVAIGAAALAALHDRRGELDRDGRRLEVTQVAVADILATAAGLVSGEGAEGVPAALIRGFRAAAEPSTAAALVRPVAEDLFR